MRATVSRLARPGRSIARAASGGGGRDIAPATGRAAAPLRPASSGWGPGAHRAATLFDELEKEMEAVSRGFFGVPFAADPFGREALAPARVAASPRAALTAAAPSHAHALGAADVKMTAEGITFHVDVPGVRKEALTVEVDPDDRVLTIAGSRAEALAPSADDKQEGEAKEGEGEEDAKQAASAVVRVERAASFVRRFALPPTADIDAITSSLSHGVLTVMVPAAAEPEKPAVRKIEVAAE